MLCVIITDTPFQIGALNLLMNSQKGDSDNSKKEVMLKGQKKFSWGMPVLYMS